MGVGCQEAARVDCSATDVPGAEQTTEAGESSHLTNQEPGCRVASQRQDWVGRQWLGALVTQQGRSDEAGPRPSQDA